MINQETYKKLKRAYEKAKKQNKTMFMFDGNQLLVDYAKYLLQFMEMRLRI